MTDRSDLQKKVKQKGVLVGATIFFELAKSFYKPESDLPKLTMKTKK